MKRRLTALAALAGLLTWTAISVVGDAARTSAPASAEPLLQLGVAHKGDFYPPVGTKPIVFLVLGDSSSRTVEESKLSDSIHLVGYNPEVGKASILGFPRDLWVPIPGYGTRKINEATHYGGPDLMVETIEDLTGIHIDYYASTGFTTFRQIVQDLGGVVVKVPYAIDDSHTGLNVDKGKEEMNGKESLDFVRSRYGVPNGDFSRSENQGIFLQSLLDKLHKAAKNNPGVVLDWLGTGLRNTENDIPLDQLTALALAATQLSSKDTNNEVVPGTIGTAAGGVSIVELAPQATKVFKDMAKDGLIKGGN